MAQWLNQWSRSLISNHIKDIRNFSSPQKSVVSNIAFRKRLSIKYHWCWHFSLNSILRRWTHFEAWQLLNFQYSFQFCIHDFLSGYNWFVWPNLLPLLTICSDKKTIRVNTSYFSYLFPNKLMTTEIFQKWKENDLVVTHKISKKNMTFFLYSSINYISRMQQIYSNFYICSSQGLCIDCKKETSRCTTNLDVSSFWIISY